MSIFFVDIDIYGNSLANTIFPRYNPCLIEVSEEYLRCLTNKGTIEFDIERGELSKIDRRPPITDISILPELFHYDYDYFIQNLKFNRGWIVLKLKEWFEGFLKGGPRGFGELIYNSSNKLLDYEKVKNSSEYAFWVNNKDGWEIISLPLLLNILYDLAEPKIKSTEIFRDGYLFSEFTDHHGFQLVKYVSDIA